MLIHTTRIKTIVISKVTDFTFCCEKEQIINENIKKEPSIKPYGILFTVFVESLNFEPI